MIKRISLSNGTLSCTAHGVDKKIIEVIDNAEKLCNSDLVIVKTFLYNDECPLMQRNYLILKTTKEELDILETYTIKTEEDERNMLMGQFGELYKKTSILDINKVLNYKYFKDIESKWEEFCNDEINSLETKL